MSTVFATHNQLPTLDAAEAKFTSREETFAAVKALLDTYDNKFCLCLVHAHCKLAEGEIMLARGNVTEPEPVASLTEYFPERWLASGEPYEFTTRPTTSPPAALVEAFKALIGVAGVLGLYHINKTRDGKWIEHSEGRKNIIQPLADEDVAVGVTQSITAWDFGSFDPVTLACKEIHVCNKSESNVFHDGT